MAKRSKKRCEELPILHPDAAGIDVGASELFVAVSADRDPQPVRSFPTFTRDLNALADWLQQCGILSVAMESTSVYWIPGDAGCNSCLGHWHGSIDRWKCEQCIFQCRQ